MTGGVMADPRRDRLDSSPCTHGERNGWTCRRCVIDEIDREYTKHRLVECVDECRCGLDAVLAALRREGQ